MKIGVLGAVIALQEKEEHRNALQAAPLFGRADNYLEAVATEMTRRGAISLAVEDARAIAVAAARDVVQRNQIAEVPQPAAVLAALTAHHVLERGDYPGVSFRFAHQQFSGAVRRSWHPGECAWSVPDCQRCSPQSHR